MKSTSMYFSCFIRWLNEKNTRVMMSKKIINGIITILSFVLVFSCEGKEKENTPAAPLNKKDEFAEYTSSAPDKLPGIWLYKDDYDVTVLHLIRLCDLRMLTRVRELPGRLRNLSGNCKADAGGGICLKK